MDSLLQDVRAAVRRLLKARAYTATAILTLALGIGATSAVYSVADAVLFEPLPYTASERLDVIRVTIGDSEGLASVSPPELLDFRAQSRLYEDFAAFWIGTTVLTVEGEARRVRSGWATANLFSLLGFDPVLGRHFDADDEESNAELVVILSHDLWQRQFGGDPEIVGQTIHMGRGPRKVVGVMPADLRVLLRRPSGFSQAPDIWEPNTFWTDRSTHWLRVFARRKSGVTLEQAEAEMHSIAARLAAEYTEYGASGVDFHPRPLHGDLVREVRPALYALTATAVFLLLVAAANLAGMALARVGGRSQELALLTALGATRWRLLRQLLVENAILAGLGAAAGLYLAHLGLRLLLVLRPAQLPRLDEIAIDARVLAMTAAATVIVLFLSTLAAGIHASRETEGSLQGARASSPRHRERTLQILVAVEMALTLVLLIGAGLMIRTFDGLKRVDLGFDAAPVLTTHLSLPRSYSAEKQLGFLLQTRDEIRALPGVEAVGAVHRLPFSNGFETGPYAYDDESAGSFGSREAEYRAVLPGFFASVGARLADGRYFLDEDVLEDRAVVVVDEDLARLAWPGENAVGKRLMAKPDAADAMWYNVIGVVAHLRQEELAGPERPQVYFHRAPFGGADMSYTIRSSGNLESLAGMVHARIRELDPLVPVDETRPLAALVSDVLADTRFVTVLMNLFAVLGLILAAIGIHAVISIWVGERIPSLGLRLAIGARPGDILNLVLGRAAVVAVAGLLAGLAASLALAGFLESLLFEVSPTDPWTLASVSLLLLAVALGACLTPAIRASRIDPVMTLRHE